MTERERLTAMIQSAVGGCARHWAEVIADYLLEHGVTLSDEEVIVNIDRDAIGQAVWDGWVSFMKQGGKNMTELERLTKHIESAMYWGADTPEKIAERLIDEGVICPPCRVGDVVYRICGTKKHHFVAERIVMCIEVYEYGFVIGTDGAKNILGKTVFLTREEAEAALAERRKEC